MLLEAKVQTGTLHLDGSEDCASNWQFMTKFGYGIGIGDYQVRFKVPATAPGSRRGHAVKLSLILDEEWSRAQTLTSCDSKVAEARRTHDVALAGPDEWSYWEHGTVVQNVRSHIWYIGVSRCHEDLSASPLQLDFEIRMRQEGGSEFSLEMRGMMALNCVVLLCLVAFLLRYCSRCWAFSNSAGKLHEVIWILSSAIVLQFAAQLLHTIHLGSYRSNGRGIVTVDCMSEVLFMLSQVVLTTLLIAIAMGYTLLPSKHDCLVIVKWITLMSFAVHAALVSFAKLQEESASKYHENEGAVGWVLLSVRLMLFVWFLFATQASQREGGPRLHDFLQRFRIVGSMYFLAYPLLYVIVQIFAAYLQHPIMQVGLLTMQTASNICLGELFLSRGTYFKVSALGSSLLPGSAGAGSFNKLS